MMNMATVKLCKETNVHISGHLMKLDQEHAQNALVNFTDNLLKKLTGKGYHTRVLPPTLDTGIRSVCLDLLATYSYFSIYNITIVLKVHFPIQNCRFL